MNQGCVGSVINGIRQLLDKTKKATLQTIASEVVFEIKKLLNLASII